MRFCHQTGLRGDSQDCYSINTSGCAWTRATPALEQKLQWIRHCSFQEGHVLRSKLKKCFLQCEKKKIQKYRRYSQLRTVFTNGGEMAVSIFFNDYMMTPVCVHRWCNASPSECWPLGHASAVSSFYVTAPLLQGNFDEASAENWSQCSQSGLRGTVDVGKDLFSCGTSEENLRSFG